MYEIVQCLRSMQTKREKSTTTVTMLDTRKRVREMLTTNWSKLNFIEHNSIYLIYVNGHNNFVNTLREIFGPVRHSNEMQAYFSGSALIVTCSNTPAIAFIPRLFIHTMKMGFHAKY